jgi:hypothetical protein
MQTTDVPWVCHKVMKVGTEHHIRWTDLRTKDAIEAQQANIDTTTDKAVPSNNGIGRIDERGSRLG